MIDHISVGVADLERAARFYEATLEPRPLTARHPSRHHRLWQNLPEFWINLRAGI